MNPTQPQDQPGWEPVQPNSQLNQTPPPVQDVQFTPPAPVAQVTQPISQQPPTAPQPVTMQASTPQPRKRSIKGPVIMLLAAFVFFAIIIAVALLSAKKPATNSNTQAQNTTATTTTSPSTTAVSNATTSSDEQPYKFIDNQQRTNLQNLLTSVTTYKSQSKTSALPPASVKGWALLDVASVVDPVTNKPYIFTASASSPVGSVQYELESVCSSSNDIIPSTDTGSFALRIRLYNGTYACVDSSNAQN